MFWGVKLCLIYGVWEVLRLLLLEGEVESQVWLIWDKNNWDKGMVMEGLTCKCLELKQEFCALIQWTKRRNWWKIWSKGMIKSEKLGHKLVLNSIFNKVPEGIVLCSRHATGQKSHHGKGNGKKMSRGLPRSQGLNKYSEINSMLCKIIVFFCFCPYTKNTTVSFGLP